MAITIPIISEFSDKGLQTAQGAFNNFKAKVGEAEGAMNKFKAGGSAALDTLKANAGNFAMAAGSAIAAFAVKAIGEFQDLALEVDKFSNSTGLAAEEASRWIEVAGDIGVESGTLLSAFNKLNRAIGDNSEAFAELGVEIVRTSSGATDVNATFLATIEALRRVEDPAKRARLATQTLGKSWTELSEVVEMGSKNLSAALEDVSDAKIINEDEIAKAKELRVAQDALNDAIEDFTLQVGQKLIPALTSIVKFLGPVTKAMLDFNREINWWDLTGIGIIDSVSGKMSDWFGSDELAGMVERLKELQTQTQSGTRSTEYLVNAWKHGTRAMINAQQAADDLTMTTEDLTYAWEELLGKVDEQTAWNNLQDQLQQVRDASFEAFVTGTADDLRVAQNEAADLVRQIARYVNELGTIPPEVQTKIIGLLDRGKFDEALAIVENLRRGANVPITTGGIPVGPGETPSEVNPPGRRPAAPLPIRTPRPIAGAYSSVTVNVGGSVISENDLVETVRKGLVNSQRNGAGLVYVNK